MGTIIRTMLDGWGREMSHTVDVREFGVVVIIRGYVRTEDEVRVSWILRSYTYEYSFIRTYVRYGPDSAHDSTRLDWTEVRM